MSFCSFCLFLTFWSLSYMCLFILIYIYISYFYINFHINLITLPDFSVDDRSHGRAGRPKDWPSVQGNSSAPRLSEGRLPCFISFSDMIHLIIFLKTSYQFNNHQLRNNEHISFLLLLFIDYYLLLFFSLIVFFS